MFRRDTFPHPRQPTNRLTPESRAALECMLARGTMQRVAITLGTSPITLEKLRDGGPGRPDTVDRLERRIRSILSQRMGVVNVAS